MNLETQGVPVQHDVATPQDRWEEALHILGPSFRSVGDKLFPDDPSKIEQFIHEVEALYAKMLGQGKEGVHPERRSLEEVWAFDPSEIIEALPPSSLITEWANLRHEDFLAVAQEFPDEGISLGDGSDRALRMRLASSLINGRYRSVDVQNFITLCTILGSRYNVDVRPFVPNIFGHTKSSFSPEEVIKLTKELGLIDVETGGELFDDDSFWGWDNDLFIKRKIGFKIFEAAQKAGKATELARRLGFLP